jgi:uncharacterized protein (DUF305 family)
MVRCLLVAVLLLLTGCGSALTTPVATVESAPPLDDSFNETDVMFLQMLIPHHRQGVRMAELAATQARRPEVRDFAAAVALTQKDEVADMERWLTDWNQPVAADPDPNAHHGHGDGLHTPDPAVVTALAETIPAEFDHTFLTLLTGHQHGAVELARLELEKGRHPDARELADRVVKSRTAQVRQMATLLED